ncbi:hypothetical protein LCDVSa166R [Lymphocystis disease virus 3]|uniref:Uncharacterized protein n=1 Tax=Lymphocystis disease virus 3 TaxID=2560566 RepID=A0A1B2RW57_9VIRU|nr:hypothetical protein BZK12_gp166 [Lymphocystis disease virus Sa]AOC55250.1 hypothetical protein LCDVSa166R [Lymphocystis disease virus 3]
MNREQKGIEGRDKTENLWDLRVGLRYKGLYGLAVIHGQTGDLGL